jgi:SAM-dependent methyltransferase
VTRQPPAGPLVDYEKAAAAYDHGRALPDEPMTRWVEAVRHRLPPVRLRLVVDVGAGTGLFLPMWHQLGAEQILAVEPSALMRAAAKLRAAAAPADVVAGNAATLPVADQCVAAVWMSAVLHHLPDQPAALADARRILQPGGRLFLRGYFPDTSSIPWLHHVPGHDSAVARFPTTINVRARLAATGLRVVDVVNVVETASMSGVDAAAWIQGMRHADSILTGIHASDLDLGITSLSRVPADIGPLTLTLLTAQRA